MKILIFLLFLFYYKILTKGKTNGEVSLDGNSYPPQTIKALKPLIKSIVKVIIEKNSDKSVRKNNLNNVIDKFLKKNRQLEFSNNKSNRKRLRNDEIVFHLAKNTHRLMRRSMFEDFAFLFGHLIDFIKDRLSFWKKCDRKTTTTTQMTKKISTLLPSSTSAIETSFAPTFGTDPVSVTSTFSTSQTSITNTTSFISSTATFILPVISTTKIQILSNLSCYQESNTPLESATKVACQENQKYCFTVGIYISGFGNFFQRGCSSECKQNGIIENNQIQGLFCCNSSLCNTINLPTTTTTVTSSISVSESTMTMTSTTTSFYPNETFIIDPKYCQEKTFSDCKLSTGNEPINITPFLCQSMCSCQPLSKCTNNGAFTLTSYNNCKCLCMLGYSGSMCEIKTI